VQEGCSQAVGKHEKALVVTTQRKQCWHLQRVACNKASECLMTNWDFALDLKKALKTMIYTRRNRNRKRVQKREEKELS
jgi:hypothetical protein